MIYHTFLYKSVFIFLLLILNSYYISLNGQPSQWQASGIGGGGALFSPSINPHNTNEVYIASDLTAMYNSTNFGESWTVVPFYELTALNESQIQFTADPNNPEVAYASVAHSEEGDIYKTNNLSAGTASSWTRLSSPPRTEGHPFQIKVLNDGTIVCTYSGRRDPGFTASSGLFVSTNGGNSWSDRSDPGMNYWSKDVVIDPHDGNQQTWYVAVFSGWGGAANDLGGIYRTTDRGINWTRIYDLDRVESMTIDPDNGNEMYVTTEYEGLWYTDELNNANPSFFRLDAYPFQHPIRVFFNPYNTNEIWVSSFGNGMKSGNKITTSVHPTASTQRRIFRLSPNPANDHVLLKGEAQFSPGQYQVQLVNTSGQTVRQISFILNMQHAEHPLPLSQLPTGQYFIHIRYRGKLMQILPLVVQR
ncbi:MAG: hypothetical protein DHS20C18_04470 [Saprospiraceae bacterium]|nr:MAG: hypothetical protein DHS20C18_04470 [Saprospiraceae bacterium]